jgi:hypothetical protein
VFDPEIKNNWVVLYLHGNSSSKVESYSIREYLPFRYSLASFDFMGCGRNFEEDTITLGYREAQQVETVVDFLRQKGYSLLLPIHLHLDNTAHSVIPSLICSL